ncbi:MAG: SCP2 sterol-binding domain-containing protein [Gammaproteobacteria bacterium]|nr:SCP2 sterol-binding domain-containing protein [Gammaproteobacteria bacterium]MBT8134732.1 SCP2 sterol-binding domain-containing protein [Gammaproteobacteria bacterium]NNJ49289.1 sterol-binding protein [Gammaproteobacteria bacterium]
MLVLESVINRYLALDPEMLGKLSEFDGKVIKLEMIGINKTLYMLPNESGIQVLAEYDGDADTVLRGTPISLFKMGLVSNAANLLLKGEVEISGDTRLGHKFKNLFSQMDIDWSEPLAGLLGDDLAYQLQQAGSKLGRWGKDSVKSVSSSFSEYLQEESRDVVSETELEIFNEDVDRLRNDVDRLQAKINVMIGSRLKSKE